MGKLVSSLQLEVPDAHIRYSHSQLLVLRRQMLRYARSVPPGSMRNDRRQIARSLHSLFSNKTWLGEHTVEGS